MSFFRKSFMLFLTIFICFIFSPSSVFASGDFNQGGGYEAGKYAVTGVPASINWSHQSSYAGPLQKPQKVWEYPFVGVVDNSYSCITVDSSGTAYVATWDSSQYEGHLYAINNNGTQKWVKDFPKWSVTEPVITSDGRMYISGMYKYAEIIPSEDNLPNSGFVKEINPSDGSEIWSYDIPGFAVWQPILDKDGNLFVAGRNRNSNNLDKDDIFCLTPSGTLKWSRFLSNWNEGAPALGNNGYLYIVSGLDSNKALYALDKTDGAQKWKFSAPSGSMYSKIVLGNDGTVYVSTGSGYFNIYAVNQNTGIQEAVADAYNFGMPDAVASDNYIWSQGGLAYSPDLKKYGSVTLGHNLDSIGTNGFFGHLASWSEYKVKGDYPDGTEAWSISADEINMCAYALVQYGDGGLYIVGSGKLAFLQGSTDGGNDVTSVTLKLSPEGNVSAGKSVVFKANAHGGSNVEYQFVIINTYTGETISTSDYTQSNTYTWNPAVPAQYKVYVNARSANSSIVRKSEDQYIVVTKSSDDVPVLSASPAKPVKVGENVTLKTKQKAIKKPEYKYYIKGPADNEFIEMGDWSKMNSYKWKAVEAGVYQFKTEVRDAVNSGGSTESNTVTVTVLPYDAPVLSAGSAKPVKVGKSVTLNIKQKGIKKPEYKYYIKSPADSEFVELSDWGKMSSYKWKGLEAGVYQFKAEVRDSANTGSAIESNTVTVTVTQ